MVLKKNAKGRQCEGIANLLFAMFWGEKSSSFIFKVIITCMVLTLCIQP